ncbi:mitochondrial import inner membrane translocase, subunit Tim17/22 [Parathielavia appendiculata]|uniref:Mitochondrial import inner membrane translocase subunit TIM22 n=1 Tax=Parathielavia appendiculata TaxID=2587402 RepID=A0AAN6U9K0_9PEZI|nr:mitochondrial import inner membrane translocase, subunit Tim17/22 [Parathielavia appendiculata]
MNFPGGGGGIPGIPSAGAGASPPGSDPNDPNVKWLTNAMESCYAKTVMSGVAGFALGGVFGMFMASMAYDTPYHVPGAPAAAAVGGGGTAPRVVPGVPGSAAASVELSSLPLRKQLAHGFKDMGTRSWSTAKNFGAVGALFSGIECGIEGLRAKNDMGNGVAAGCLTGAILARNGGPQAAAVGCAGFAAFSAAIDAWMRMPKDED